MDAFLALPPSEVDAELFGVLEAALQTALAEHGDYADLHLRASAVLDQAGAAGRGDAARPNGRGDQRPIRPRPAAPGQAVRRGGHWRRGPGAPGAGDRRRGGLGRRALRRRRAVGSAAAGRARPGGTWTRALQLNPQLQPGGGGDRLPGRLREDGGNSKVSHLLEALGRGLPCDLGDVLDRYYWSPQLADDQGPDRRGRGAPAVAGHPLPVGPGVPAGHAAGPGHRAPPDRLPHQAGLPGRPGGPGGGLPRRRSGRQGPGATGNRQPDPHGRTGGAVCDRLLP